MPDSRDDESFATSCFAKGKVVELRFYPIVGILREELDDAGVTHSEFLKAEGQMCSQGITHLWSSE